jgi:hypothetical protein
MLGTYGARSGHVLLDYDAEDGALPLAYLGVAQLLNSACSYVKIVANRQH